MTTGISRRRACVAVLLSLPAAKRELTPPPSLALSQIEPRFGFGFGLSYSEFSFSNLSVAELPWEKRHLADQHVYRRTWNESTAPATNGSASVGDVGSSVAEWCALAADRLLPSRLAG